MANLIYRNQASKIFIYDSKKVNDTELCEDGQADEKDSSITILTSGYHIRIKNNFNESLEPIVGEPKAEPKSCESLMKNNKDTVFSMNEDVLLKSVDGKLYLGTVVNIQNGKYLVKFDDNTEKWSCEKGLKKLNSSLSKSANDSEPLCVVCKLRNDTDVVEVCNKCCRGYHRHCLKRESSNFSSPWCCDRCTASEIISISDSEDNESEVAVPLTVPKSFPYDMKSLTWDSYHRENKEQTYCYCGKTGSWKMQMLQCCKCQQWFHEKCIGIWKGYLMHGDTFFIFCCKVCDKENEEFLHRLNFNWNTAIHLVLHEFTVTRPQKFYSISKDLAPFLWEKWDELHLPLPKYHSKEKLEKKVNRTVKQGEEFKSVGGNKHKGDSVALRRKSPPVSPKFCLPLGVAVSEKMLKKFSIKSFALDDKGMFKTAEAEIEKPSKLLPKEKRRKRAFHASSNVDGSPQSFDNDSSDETSSRSTLDWIIPPPSNFHGRNNPFHSQYKFSSNFKASEKMLRKGKQDRPPEVRIVRTIKRRLSAKDIAMGFNGEAKRRKVIKMKRRKSTDVEIISEIIQPVTMPLPTYFPLRGGDSKDSSRSSSVTVQSVGESSYSSSARNSRHSQGKKFERSLSKANCEFENQISAVINSPIKNKSISMYFGAYNRIENGEKFKILAKRMTLDGRAQYLFEWDSSKSCASMPAVKNEL